MYQTSTEGQEETCLIIESLDCPPREDWQWILTTTIEPWPTEISGRRSLGADLSPGAFGLDEDESKIEIGTDLDAKCVC